MGDLCAYVDANNSQSMIVEGSLVDKPNATKMLNTVFSIQFPA